MTGEPATSKDQLNAIKAASRNNDVETAVRLLDLMDVKSSEFAPAAMQTAQVLIGKAKYDAARKYIDIVLADQPNSVAANVMLGRLFEATRQWDRAVAPYAHASALKPLDDKIFERHVAVLRSAGRTAEADAAQKERRERRGVGIDELTRWSQAPAVQPPGDVLAGTRRLYLDLLEKTLCNVIYRDGSISPGTSGGFDSSRRAIGKDWPRVAHTMIGQTRLRQLREAAEMCLTQGVAGDFLEAGVWRGGACILLRGVLAAYGNEDRSVWVADSFRGLPPPDPRYQEDALSIYKFHEYSDLSIGRAQVQANFDLYGLLNEQVKFVEGLFKDTLPQLAVGKLAILRLDGDMYSSTMDTLNALYDKVSEGGFVIVDDFGSIEGARSATNDFRARHNIAEPMYAIDQDGVFWRRGVS